MSLQRLNAFHKSLNVGRRVTSDDAHLGFLDNILDLLHIVDDAELGSAEDALLPPAVVALECALLWALSDVKTEAPNRSMLHDLATRVRTAFDVLERLLAYPSLAVSEAAFLHACDLLLAFNRTLRFV